MLLSVPLLTLLMAVELFRCWCGSRFFFFPLRLLLELVMVVLILSGFAVVGV